MLRPRGDRTWGNERAGSGGRERPGTGRAWPGGTRRRPGRHASRAAASGLGHSRATGSRARAQLNSLPNDLADIVARYLVAAGVADDPEQGYAYAQVASAWPRGSAWSGRPAASPPTGPERWAEALAELRAARRMTGRDDYLPIMADCERALGRLDRALALVREASAANLDRATQIELRIVESGIRRDQGLSDAAVLALQVPELTRGRLRPWSARLFYAYADALLGGRARGRGPGCVRPCRGSGHGRRDRRRRPPRRARRHRIRRPRR